MPNQVEPPPAVGVGERSDTLGMVFDYENNGMGLHPETAGMVRAFSHALALKLKRAEDKYGYSDGWKTEAWEDECRRQLRHHTDKGDPLDVAAYAAFCWARHWSTALTTPPPSPDREKMRNLALVTAHKASQDAIRDGMSPEATVTLITLSVLALIPEPAPLPSAQAVSELVEAAKAVAEFRTNFDDTDRNQADAYYSMIKGKDGAWSRLSRALAAVGSPNPGSTADAEVERILALTDAEVIAETVSAGLDPEAVADEVRQVAKRAIDRADALKVATAALERNLATIRESIRRFDRFGKSSAELALAETDTAQALATLKGERP